MATSIASRPLALVRIFLYFVVWVFSIAVFADIVKNLYFNTPLGKYCLLSSDDFSTSFCKWGIAGGVIGFVVYLVLDVLVAISLFASSLMSMMDYVELVVNAIFIFWYLALAVVMSIGIARFKTLTGGLTTSEVNAPAALSWVSFVCIIVAEILVAIDFGKSGSVADEEPEPAATEA
jgi:hypothetical protein